MHSLINANMDGIEDISEREIDEMRGYAQSIANMLEVVMVNKSIPTGSIYWRAAKILSKMDNYLDKHEGDHAIVLRKDQGVLVDAELLDHLQGTGGVEPVAKRHSQDGSLSMLIYKNGEFIENPYLGAILEDAEKANDSNLDIAISNHLGFIMASEHSSPNDTETLSVSTYVSSDAHPAFKGYDFLVVWCAAGVPYVVLIAGVVDYYSFLEKALPVIKMGGELQGRDDD